MGPHKQAFFTTLNGALASEDLLDSWDMYHAPIPYGETYCWVWEDGTPGGHFVSIMRDGITGRYERPIHYAL